MAKQSLIKLPGFGLSLDDWGDDYTAQELSVVMEWTHELLTVREKCMLFFMNQITDTPEWHRKVHDPNIVTKWRKEADDWDWGALVTEHGDMSPKMFNFCIEELRAAAAVYEKTGIVSALDSNSCVLKSDTAISVELKQELRNAVATLEDVPNHQKDWHPGSDGKVLDLVHPSLFPLIYTRSRILPDSTINVDNCIEAIGKGEIVPEPPNLSAYNEFWSSRFQWLPCNVSFPDGENARIDSYINNLHPVDHKDLYAVIEKIITRVIPLWNIVYLCPSEYRRRIECYKVSYQYPGGVDWKEEGLPDDFDGDGDEYYESLRIYDKPEPQEHPPPKVTVDAVEKKFEFLQGLEKKIQVIVKLANIHLTPEKPDYEGGSWHIEGQLNEHIVASALYYYENENITDSHLSFRGKLHRQYYEENIDYAKRDYYGISLIFGLYNYGTSVQEIGSVLTREDRLIAFPNGLQHQVGRFELADPTRPGHRKILALFLVAPTIPIISTANIPPQQRDWWLRELKAGGSKISNLPAELVDMIGDRINDFPIGLVEAKALREELMEERGKLDHEVEALIEGEYFSFSERWT